MITLELENGVKRPIHTQVALLQQIDYKVKGNKHQDSQQVNSLDLGVIPKKQRQSSSNYYIQVPAMAPSISSCNIVTVGYTLQVRACYSLLFPHILIYLEAKKCYCTSWNFSRWFYFREFRESNPRENFHFNLCLFMVMTTSAKSRN